MTADGGPLDDGDGTVVGAVESWLLSLAEIPPPRGPGARDLAHRLVAARGHPQRSAPAVHLVGTAGKGTVAWMLSHRARAAGRCVATHQSPHVADVRERFLVDLAYPADEDLAAAAASVRAAVEAVGAEHGRPPTFFAATATLSWELGRHCGADLFVTEAGIGGRFDATAVLDRPDTLTVVTAVGLDHADVLGGSVAAIAGEKAAVLEGRRVAVLGPQPDAAATRVVRQVASAHGVELIEVPPAGDWRADAAATVDAAAEVLGLDGPGGEPRPPGRYDVRSLGGCRVVLDGAHNPMKLRALVDTVLGDERPAIALVALAATKDPEGCAAELARLGCPVVTTEWVVAGGRRSHEAPLLADVLRRRGVDATAEPALASAVARARAVAGPEATVLVTGSFLVLADAAAAFAD